MKIGHLGRLDTTPSKVTTSSSNLSTINKKCNSIKNLFPMNYKNFKKHLTTTTSTPLVVHLILSNAVITVILILASHSSSFRNTNEATHRPESHHVDLPPIVESNS